MTGMSFVDPVVSVEFRRKWRQERIDGVGESGRAGCIDELQNSSLMGIRVRHLGVLSEVTLGEFKVLEEELSCGINFKIWWPLV